MRYGEEVGAMFRDRVSNKQIDKFFQDKQEKIEKKELFDFVRGVSLWNHLLLKKFITERRSDFLLEDLWRMVFQNTDSFIPRGMGDESFLNTINQSNMDTAIFILCILEGQDKIEKTILDASKNKKIDKNVLYRVINSYVNLAENYDIIFVNCNFLRKILEVIFVFFPEFSDKYPQDYKDSLLISFIHLYRHLTPGMVKDLFEKNVIEKINNISEDVWNRKFGLNKSKIAEFVKRQYQYNKEFNNYTLESDNDLDREKLKKIFEIIWFSDKEREEIESFLQKNSLSSLGQVHYMLTCFDERTDNDIRHDKDVYKFIKDNIKKFSYEEMLDKILHCITSDPLTEWGLLIMFLLKDSKKVIDDILKEYVKGNCNKDSLRYIVYIYPRLARFDIIVDKYSIFDIKKFLENKD